MIQNQKNLTWFQRRKIISSLKKDRWEVFDLFNNYTEFTKGNISILAEKEKKKYFVFSIKINNKDLLLPNNNWFNKLEKLLFDKYPFILYPEQLIVYNSIFNNEIN